MIVELQSDTTFIQGDTFFFHACHQRMYDFFKARFLEGVSDADIQGQIGTLNQAIHVDTLNEEWDKYEEHVQIGQHYIDILRCKTMYRNNKWTIDTVCGKMIDNGIYDEINMNTFNFINASFDNFFWRYPSEQEF